ncbi:conserved exported hypothetical protein [Paraburkholderia piptadeniae]|uniref:DUF3592 domain-containing protein n=1 Tax=Paraburkholderia piptadeniae TaxID=1701573 RepID=A0A1N7RUB6_9BURK|nr:conserved exported hypothetical protein [Paraburkholderia piptadeniae]
MKCRNYFALLIGLCLSVGAAFYVYSVIEFCLSSVVVTGKVVRLNAGGHHPQIAFDAKDGRHFERPTGTTWSYEAGQVVPIRYSPDDPDGSAMIDSAIDLWRWPLFVVFLAAAFVTSGLRGEPLENRRKR